VPEPGFVSPPDGPIEWIADNTVKGLVTSGSAALTIHARPDYSRLHMDSPREEIARELLAAAEPWLGSAVNEWQLHRWRYARPVPGDRPLFLATDAPARLAIAGDSFGGPRVEGAFLSGQAAAQWLAS
jgi:renalase